MNRTTHVQLVHYTHPLIFGSDDEILVLLRNHAAGAVGGLQHVDDQVVGQHVQLLHIVPCHVHGARQTLSVRSDQQQSEFKPLTNSML